MAIEFDDAGLRVIGNNVKGIAFYDDNRVLRQTIYLKTDNTLNIGGAGGGGVTVETALTPHELSGSIHNGTLAPSQFPTALLTTGARSLTGVLTSTVATGTAPFVVASRTRVANLNADLWDGYEFASYLNQAVKTTSAPTFAGLTLSGDLAVKTDLLFVDYSGDNVGINCTPDSQFDLDIAGNLRVQGWIVGRHAIQLDGATMICHYDGPAPFETDHTVVTTGHMGQQPATQTGGVVGRAGKFQKAIQVAPGTTNLIINPVCEVGVAVGWYKSNLTVFGRVTSDPYIGTGNFYASVTNSSGSNEYAYTAEMTVTAGSAYALQMMIRKTVPGGRISVGWYDASSHLGGDNLDLEAGAHDDWTLYTLKVTAPAGATRARVVVNPRLLAGQSGVIEFDAVQFEQSSYVTPFCYGDMPGHSWSGTPHQSTSVRPGAALTYAMKDVGLDPRKGSISMWVKQIDINTAAGFLWSAGNAPGEFDAYIASNGNVYFRENANSVGGTPTDLTQWTHFVFTWDTGANAITIYENGAYLASRTYSAVTLGSQLGVGYLAGNSTWYDANALIDDFVVLDRALSADEVRAIYESDAPVFAETSTFTFRTPTANPVYADNEGLWIEDTDAVAVFGVYAASATKAWGGFTLSPGDIVLGSNVTDSAAILWDQSAGTFGFYGDGDSTPQVEINTDGTLTAAGGDIILSDERMKILSHGNGAFNMIEWSNDETYDMPGCTGFANFQATDPFTSDDTGLFDIGMWHDADNQISLAFHENQATFLSKKAGDWRYLLILNHSYISIAFEVPLVLGSRTTDPTVGMRDGAIYYNWSTHKFRGLVNGTWVNLN